MVELIIVIGAAVGAGMIWGKKVAGAILLVYFVFAFVVLCSVMMA